MTDLLVDRETLLLDIRDGYLEIKFNRPQQRNAMNDQMIAELHSVVDALATDLSVRAVVLRGTGAHFCAGGDIKERRDQVEQMAAGDDPIYVRNVSAGQLFKKIAQLPQTTIAYVEGAALGGGFGLTCLADITLVDAEARLGMPETTLGVAPAQIAAHVVRRLGLTKARHLALTGRRINGEEAVALGIAQYLFHGGDDGERQLVQLLAEVGRCGPAACAATKAIINAVAYLDADQIIDYGARRFAELNQGDEGREGQLAFVEKRQPRWPRLRGPWPPLP